MVKNWYVVTVVAVLLVAAVSRLYQLGNVPHGMTIDEAAIGYNGHAIRVARRDEWLIKLPLSFRSFGDYKSPLAIYINGLFTGSLGMNLFAVRLPFALSGIAAVGFMIGLTRVLLDSSLSKTFSLYLSQQTKWLALLAGILMATMPWHVHYSRLGFEAGIALMWLLAGVWLLFKWLYFPVSQKWWLRIGLLLASAAALALTTYTYHSAKIVMPLLVVAIGLLWHERVRKNLRLVLAFLVTLFLLVSPLLVDTFWGTGAERFNQASLFNKGLSPLVLAETIGHQFVQHLEPQFLVFGQTTTLRHGDGMWGVLLITGVFLTLIGLAAFGNQLVIWVRRQATLGEIRLPLLGFIWLLAGTLPASIGVDSPHSNRALMALPGFILLAVWGAAWGLESIRGSSFNKNQSGTHGEKQSLVKMVIGTWLLIHSLLFLSYQRHYFTVFAAQSAVEFNDGYLEAFQYAVPYEKGLNGIQPVDQIIFSSAYGHPYIYALFVRKTNPIYYQGGSLNKYLFVDKIDASALDRPNVLVVASGKDEMPFEKADKIIYGSDGSVRFSIYRTK